MDIFYIKGKKIKQCKDTCTSMFTLQWFIYPKENIICKIIKGFSILIVLRVWFLRLAGKTRHCVCSGLSHMLSWRAPRADHRKWTGLWQSDWLKNGDVGKAAKLALKKGWHFYFINNSVSINEIVLSWTRKEGNCNCDKTQICAYTVQDFIYVLSL